MAMPKSIVLLFITLVIASALFAEVAEGNKEIGTGALGENGIPCDPKSGSNVKCHSTQPQTPYMRGCSPLTRCRGVPHP
ncbi:unnamed protein product [Withania somnifera]